MNHIDIMLFNKVELAAKYPVYYTYLNNFIDLKTAYFPSKYFLLLILCDFSTLKETTILDVAKNLIQKGNLYVCCWGKDCNRAEISWDLASLNQYQALGQEIITTSHEKESIRDSLEFILFSANINDIYQKAASICVVTVNNRKWDKLITGYFDRI